MYKSWKWGRKSQKMAGEAWLQCFLHCRPTKNWYVTVRFTPFVKCPTKVLGHSVTPHCYNFGGYSTVQFRMIRLSRVTVGTWRVEIWYMSRVTMATWRKVENVTICLGFLLRDRTSSSSEFCSGLPKFWSCHEPLGELPKWKFRQACHGHGGGDESFEIVQ